MYIDTSVKPYEVAIDDTISVNNIKNHEYWGAFDILSYELDMEHKELDKSNLNEALNEMTLFELIVVDNALHSAVALYEDSLRMGG